MALAPKTVYTYPLDGSNRTFAINFEYLTRKFVQITLIGQDRKLLVLNQDYRFVTRTAIQTTLAWGPAQGYETIEIRRFTSATDRLVDFSDGSILRAYDLNISSVQALHIAEEARDLSADTIAVNNDGDLDARGRRIVNLADATEQSHAVTLRQEQEWAASTLGNRNAAEASANASAQSASGSTAARDRAIQAENKAKDWADASDASSKSAAASAKVATDEIAKIDGQVDVAKGWADNSKASADAAQVSNNLAALQASTAGGFAAQAATSKNAADNSAKNASEAGLQIGMSLWGYRPQPFKGCVPDDGQELEIALYPSFAQAIQDGLLPSTTEDAWQQYPAARGHFVLNSSPGKFRMRDLNGVQPGSIKGLFQRGDPKGQTNVPGIIPGDAPAIMRDQIQDHRHRQSEYYYGDEADRDNGGVPGADNTGAPGVAHAGQSLNRGVDVKVTGIPCDKKLGAGHQPFIEPNPVRHGAETRPVAITGCWMTRLFGVVTPLGTAEANSLATAYASIAGRVSALEGRKKALGDGQDWFNLTAERGPNNWYTNVTGRAIQVIIVWMQNGVQMSYFWIRKPDGTEMRVGVGGQHNVGGGGNMQAIVPQGYSYRLVLGNTYDAWFELR